MNGPQAEVCSRGQPDQAQRSTIWHAIERFTGARFVRQAPASASVHDARPTREQVAALGRETVVALRDALEAGYVERAPALLVGLDPRHAGVVAALSRMVENYEIETLLDLL